jgi:hypothetical protein
VTKRERERTQEKQRRQSLPVVVKTVGNDSSGPRLRNRALEEWIRGVLGNVRRQSSDEPRVPDFTAARLVSGTLALLLKVTPINIGGYIAGQIKVRLDLAGKLGELGLHTTRYDTAGERGGGLGKRCLYSGAASISLTKNSL